MSSETPLTFPRSHRVSSPAAFQGIYARGLKETRGFLVVYAEPNGLGHPRLGLSVPKRVGTAPRRNRVKRLLREAFRLMQHEVPAGYDLVVVVRPHGETALAEYQRAVSGALAKLHRRWVEKSAAGGAGGGTGGGGGGGAGGRAGGGSSGGT